MTWSATVKTIGVSKTVSHPHRGPGVVGCAPPADTIRFSPLALFGAAARCSHLNVVNLSVLKQDSAVMAAMIERYVAETGGDFAILDTADRLKDFVGTGLTGIVAAGLGYLAMTTFGYVWFGHFEALSGGAYDREASPDFAFATLDDVALVETKGSRKARSAAFDQRVEEGYLRQVAPRLGRAFGGVSATHGYCIGSYLQSTTQADLRIHHTAEPGLTGGLPPLSQVDEGPASVAAVQSENFATAFTLAYSAALGTMLRRPTSSLDDGRRSYGELVRTRFIRFEWRGRRWIGKRAHWDTRRRLRPVRPFAFAIEEGVAAAALAHFAVFRQWDIRLHIAQASDAGPPPADLSASDGAIFADGLAILGPEAVRDDQWEQVAFAADRFAHVSYGRRGWL